MSDEGHRRASLALEEIVRAFLLPPGWPVVIKKPEGNLTITAGDLVRRIEKRYSADLRQVS